MFNTTVTQNKVIPTYIEKFQEFIENVVKSLGYLRNNAKLLAHLFVPLLV